MTLTSYSTRIVALTLGVAAVVALALSVAVATPAHAAGICPGTTFSTNLKMGSSGAAVMALQQFLNMDPDTMIASSGVGSKGNESTYFGGLTKAAVNKFQQKYKTQILAPAGLTTPTGNFFAGSRAEANTLCSGSTGTTGTGTGTGTGTTGTAAGTAVVAAAAQPANAIAPQGASHVPYTAFTVTANGAPVTLNSVTVQRQGPSLDTDFSGVVLIDASTGIQLGTSRVLDANHNATIGTPITIPAGSSKTFWVAGNIAVVSGGIPGSGDVASFAVTAVNTASSVSGSLPISGASNTINTSLTIGTASIQTSSFDPNTAGTQPIGTTGYRFTGVRVQAGSAEDVTLKSVTWYQSGSASGLQNVVTVVSGTSYPTTIDSTGRYYTSAFPAGLVIPKGQNLELYIQGDLAGNTVANTYAEFDLYRNTDLYLVGNTYGYGITPTNGNQNAITPTYNSGSSHGTVFVSGTNPTPWIQGSTLQVTAGTFSTIQNANTVGAQNIAINVPNQPLGGFQTNITGEGIQVQTLKVHLTTSANLSPLQNVSLVNENGSVVSGPYNAVCDGGVTSNVCLSGLQTVTFTGATTFPTGLHTYTVKGQVQTQSGINSVTIQAATNPSSSDWSSATGATTGNTVAIGVSNFTMNTMTIQAAALTVSNGSTPTAQAVVAGGSNVLFATIQLDASQSGEDVRISSLPLTLTTTDTVSKMSNCQVWNGSTALNTGSYVVNGSSLASSSPVTTTFNFNNSLTIPKGTVLNLQVTCTLASNASAGATYAWAGSTTIAPTGVTSGSAITVGSIGGTAPTMTVSGGATLAVISDPSAPSYALVAGGTTGVTANVIKFRATNESINLTKVGLKLTTANASSSASDLTQVYLYAGSNIQTTSGTAVAPGTLIGTATFTGTNTTATSTLSTSVQLPRDLDATIVVKADIADIGTSQPGTEGHIVAIDWNNSEGSGANSGSTIKSGPAQGSTAAAGLRTFNTIPTIALDTTLPSTGVADGRLMQFKVTADSHGPVGINQFTFKISTTTATVTTLQLFAYTDAGYSTAVSGNFGASTGQFGSNVSGVTNGTAFVIAQGTNPIEVPAGTTYYFKLVGSVNAPTNSSVVTTLVGDASYPALPGFMSQAATIAAGAAGSNDFVWSPNATTTVSATGNDWTNGFGIVGLPAAGIFQTRSN